MPIEQMEEDLQLLLSTAVDDPTRRLEDELLGTGHLAWAELEEEKDERKQGRRRRRRLSFALAVRKRRFAMNSLLIGSRYGVWSVAECRFIRKTNLYHYHHLTQGIKDVKELYGDLFLDGFHSTHTMPGWLHKLLFVHPRRTTRILSAMFLYYHVFMAKDHRMECWLDDVYGGDPGNDRDEVTSLRHRLVDVYRGRMSPAQRQRVVAAYDLDRFAIRFSLCFIVVVLLVLFVIIAWLLI